MNIARQKLHIIAASCAQKLIDEDAQRVIEYARANNTLSLLTRKMVKSVLAKSYTAIPSNDEEVVDFIMGNQFFRNAFSEACASIKINLY